VRPINRGNFPKDNSGNDIQFKKHSEARSYLIERIGLYCCYCEIRLPMGLAVEHIQPQLLNPDLITEWNNFLLSCPSCNSRKGKKDVNSENFNDYFWPHCDNTLRAFVYENDRGPGVSIHLNETQQKTALNTLKLTGLNFDPTDRQSVKDPRWQPRLEAWSLAKLAKLDLERDSADEMRKRIVETAIAIGFWSVWMTVFQDDTDMRRRLIQAFKGTCRDCFDEAIQPLPRLGGKL